MRSLTVLKHLLYKFSSNTMEWCGVWTLFKCFCIHSFMKECQPKSVHQLQQDVGIPERQKVRKQGRDDHTKQRSPTEIFFHIRVPLRSQGTHCQNGWSSHRFCPRVKVEESRHRHSVRDHTPLSLVDMMTSLTASSSARHDLASFPRRYIYTHCSGQRTL